jgi:DNA-binding transcriptional regulator GbsR (MarR family)
MMTPRQRQFIDDMGQQMVGWGLPRTTGRLYGALLLEPEPAGLDELSGAIEVAKSGVSVAIRQLLALGLARSFGQRRSRRLLYEALYDPEAILAAREAQMRSLLERLEQGARAATPGPAQHRLTEMAASVEEWMDEIRRLAKRGRAHKQAS